LISYPDLSRRAAVPVILALLVTSYDFVKKYFGLCRKALFGRKYPILAMDDWFLCVPSNSSSRVVRINAFS
jgi:hypothetical protein